MVVVLGFVEDDDGGLVAEFGEAFFEVHEGGATGAAGFAQLACEVAEESGVAEAGLGDGDGEVEAGVELVAPVAKEMTFADAVGAAEEHKATEGGTLREVLVGLLNLGVVFLIGFGMVSGEGDGGGSPLVGVACEGGVCWHGFVGWCWWLATLVVAVIAELTVEVKVNEVGRSDVMALMIDFGVSGLIEGVVTELDTVASKGEADFVEVVVEADGAVLADGALDSGLEEFFEGFGLKF